MKKTLLSLAFLLGLGLQGYSQVTVTPQNSNLGPDFQFATMHAVDANTAWGVAGQVDGTTLVSDTYVRTTNGGTTWQGGIVQPAGTANLAIGGMSAISATTAWVAMFDGDAGGGVIAKTTNGGTTWTTQPTATFSAPDGFPNWVHFFNANEGVCMGDPNRTPTSAIKFFEIYTTSDGGTTWVRTPRANIAASNTGEFGVVSQFFALGNTVWFLTGYSSPATNPVRVYKTTDKGLNWTVSTNTPIPTQATGIAFANPTNGLLWNGANLVRSNDGGATWQTQAYSTPFHRYDLTAVPGANKYVSVGLDARVVGNPTAASQFGISTSTDFGATWVDVNTGVSYTAVSALPSGQAWVGGFTDAAGGGGLARVTGLVASSRNAELQKALAVYPNPSTSGVFTVQLAGGLKSGAAVRVIDVVGREVSTQVLNATAIAAKSTTVDLSKEKAGIYTLELRTDAGVAQQKLVIE